MKLKRTFMVAVTGATLMAPSAKATLVIDNPADFTITTPSNPSDAAIAAAIGITTAQLGTLLYKIESGGGEAGTLASSYNSSTTPWDKNTAFPLKIDYNGGTKAAATYLLVKDGNAGSRIFNISGWNGTEEIQIFNVFEPDKTDPSGTSHVEFFGVAAAAVPEPSTYIAGALLLLPFGASVIRRARKS